MSITYVGLALRARTIPSRKLVLVALAFHADGNGECWPSIPTLAAHCCMTERNVQKHLTGLEKEGLIQRKIRKGHSTFYRLVFVELKDTPEPQFTPTPEPQFTPPAITTPELQFTTHPNYSSPHPRTTVHHTPELEFTLTVIEPSKERSLNRHKQKKADDDGYSPLADLQARGVDLQTITDWLQHRKDKKLKVTRSVVAHTETEAKKAGISLAEALQTTCAMGWQGFLAKYVAPRQGPSTGYQSQRDRERQQVLDAIYGTQGGRDVLDV